MGNYIQHKGPFYVVGILLLETLLLSFNLIEVLLICSVELPGHTLRLGDRTKVIFSLGDRLVLKFIYSSD